MSPVTGSITHACQPRHCVCSEGLTAQLRVKPFVLCFERLGKSPDWPGEDGWEGRQLASRYRSRSIGSEQGRVT